MMIRVIDALPFLACPRCRAPLDTGPVALRCSRANCGLSVVDFPIVCGRHLLVDFDCSILVRENVIRSAGASPVARTAATPARSLLKRLASGENRVAARNESKFLALLRAASARPRILVIGSAQVGSGTGAMYLADDVDVIGIDVYVSDWVTFVGDAHRLALQDGSVDGVWVQAVLEHVLSPGDVVGEIARVLRTGGVVYAETPFLQAVHEGPYDFTRFTHSGHRWLFRQFREVDSGAVAGAASGLLWSIEHFVRALTRSRLAGKLVRALCSPLRFADAACARDATLDAASACFFLGTKAREGLSPSEIVDYYAQARRIAKLGRD